MNTDLLKISVNQDTLSISVILSPYIFIIVAILFGFFLYLIKSRVRKYRLVKLDISLGRIGKAEFRPNSEDIQIAHKIWTELVTRKAALPFDQENDLISEVYDSWYMMFGRVRDLISNIPAELIKSEDSTKEIVRISTTALNDGLRPHLTKWHAHFRNWYVTHSEELNSKTPQELQREFPHYEVLISELLEINKQLIKYADELKKFTQEK